MTFIAIAGTAMAMLPGITSVIVFGSGSFLAVYAIVNYLQARTADGRSERVTAWAGTALCAAALVDLVVELARAPTAPRSPSSRCSSVRSRSHGSRSCAGSPDGNSARERRSRRARSAEAGVGALSASSAWGRRPTEPRFRAAGRATGQQPAGTLLEEPPRHALIASSSAWS